MVDEAKITTIKSWLGTGSINVFGLPFSGKDTVGYALADLFGAEVISSGDLLRAHGEKVQTKGHLSPTNIFFDVVLPVFKRPDLSEKPLILSSIGRWHGEETRVIEAASTNHPIKAAILLEIPTDEIHERLIASIKHGDRNANRLDDSAEILKTRISEFNTKTLPAIETYRRLNLLITINGVGTRDEIVSRILAQLPLR
ncbi:nucleoside monophosphate kinase [Candidatus Saccharibacteria bacterium]|nr:nucleoside monophosphate kinase [Candidatus Saccharibacteria bacterium]